jgi:heme exporter protein B
VNVVAQPSRARLTAYAGDVAALVRKDLLLEMRARETVPAMLLFVVSALTVFHFAVPEDLEPATEEVVAKGLLWIAILFTALLGLARAFAAEREQDVLDGLVLAPSDRSAIWLSKTVTVTAFLVLMEVVALPVFALLYAPLDAATIGAVLLADIGIAAVGSLLSAMALASRTRELILPLLFLPLAVPIVVGGVGASIADEPARFVGFLVLYDAIFAIISWAAFEYVVTE